jgi:osmotically-inducible protein OsmY
MKKNLFLALAFSLAGSLALAQESNTPKDPTQQSNPAAQTKPDDKSTTPAQESTGAQSANTESNSKTTDSSSQETAASGTKAKASDRELDQQLHDKFAADPAFSAVHVQVKQGAVTLAGHVDSKENVAKAKELAESVDGVTSVHNHLKVASPSAAASETNANGSSDAKSTTPDLKPNVAGDQGVNPNSTGSIGKDASSANQQVSTGGNTSTTPTTNASGSTVPSNSGSIAGNTSAASGTQSGLPASDQSAAQSSSPDSTTLQSTIQEKLKNEPMLSSSSVNVNVTDSTIELSGSVSTGKEKTTAERIAQSYAGNRKVVDRITVTSNGNAASPSSSNSGSGQATPPQPDNGSTPTSANPSSTNGTPPTTQTPPTPEQSTTPK